MKRTDRLWGRLWVVELEVDPERWIAFLPSVRLYRPDAWRELGRLRRDNPGNRYRCVPYVREEPKKKGPA